MTSIRRKKPVAVHTLYMVLGMPPAATTEQLHDAYLQRAYDLRHVVNTTETVTGKDAEEFCQLTAAWSVLRDSKSRRNYDDQLRLAGNQCAVCEGKGTKWTFAARKENICAACAGTGQNQKEK